MQTIPETARRQSDAESIDSDGVARKDVEGWMRYFDEHADEFVAAHEAIIRKAQSDAEPPGLKAADEIERLMTENKKLKEQRAAWERTIRTALSQSAAEPAMRDRLAVCLLALDECDSRDDPKKYISFFEHFLAKHRHAEHSGDCKKEPWSCCRCICDEYLKKASDFLSAFSTFTQPDAEAADASVGLIEAALTVEPHIAGDGFGKERSLEWMVRAFYKQHLPDEKAKDAADRYLTAIRACAADNEGTKSDYIPVSTGLIEAAEIAEQFAGKCEESAPISADAIRDYAKLLRARAADRSAK